jgi:hypothetical protein
MLAYRLVHRPVASRQIRRRARLWRAVSSFEVKFRRGIDFPR